MVKILYMIVWFIMTVINQIKLPFLHLIILSQGEYLDMKSGWVNITESKIIVTHYGFRFEIPLEKDKAGPDILVSYSDGVNSSTKELWIYHLPIIPSIGLSGRECKSTTMVLVAALFSAATNKRVGIISYLLYKYALSRIKPRVVLIA